MQSKSGGANIRPGERQVNGNCGYDCELYGPVLPYEKVDGSPGCIALARTKTHLFASGGEDFSVYDISVPNKPKRIASLGDIGGGRQIAISGNLLFLTARENGMWIIDIADPANPRKILRYDTIELATGVDAIGTTVFIAQRVYGVQILDVSNPSKPKHLSLIRTFEAQSVYYEDNKIYIGDWETGQLIVADVSDPARPKCLSASQLDGYGDGIYVEDNICYAATGHDRKFGDPGAGRWQGHGLELFELASPEKPKFLSRVKFPALETREDDYWTVRAFEGTAFVADTHNGFFMVETKDPRRPQVIGQLKLPEYKFDSGTWGDCAGDVEIGDEVVYVAAKQSGLLVVEAPGKSRYVEAKRKPLPAVEPAPPELPENLLRFAVDDQVRRVAIAGDFAYAACSHAGLKLFRLTPDRIELVKTWRDGCYYDAVGCGNRLYVGIDNVKLAIFEIQLDGDLKKLGEHSRPKTFQILHTSSDGRYLFSSGGTGLMYIHEVSDPQNLRLLLKHSVRGLLYGDMIPDGDIGGRFMVNWHHTGICWFDLNQGQPVSLKDIIGTQFASQISGVCTVSRRFFIPSVKGGYYLFDPENYERVPKEHFIEGTCLIGVPSACGSIVAIANRRTGEVTTIDLSDPEKGRLVSKRCYNLWQGNPDRIRFWNGKMVIPAGHLGLLMEK